MYLITNEAHLEAVAGGVETVTVTEQKVIKPIDPRPMNPVGAYSTGGFTNGLVNAASEMLDAVKKAADAAAKAAANVSSATKNLSNVGIAIKFGTAETSVCFGSATAHTTNSGCGTTVHQP